MRTFSQFLAEAISLAPDKDFPGVYYLSVGGKRIGGIELGRSSPKSTEVSAAARLFPGIVKPGQSVSRTNGIVIEDEDMLGKGYGQQMYLLGMLTHGADWYYNSQTESGATNALKALADKGLIKLYWANNRIPGWDEEGGVHLVGLTDKGRYLAAQGK